MGKYSAENATLAQVRKELQETLNLLDPVTHKAAHAMTFALAYIVEQIGRLRTDVDLLHNKLQPILKELEEDSNWRDRNPKYEE